METYKVKVAINKHISADIEIPSELDASELYALLDMAKKLASIAPMKSEKQSTVRKIVPWNDKEKAIIRKLWKDSETATANADRIAEHLKNRTPSKIKSQYYYLRDTGVMK